MTLIFVGLILCCSSVLSGGLLHILYLFCQCMVIISSSFYASGRLRFPTVAFPYFDEKIITLEMYKIHACTDY